MKAALLVTPVLAGCFLGNGSDYGRQPTAPGGDYAFETTGAATPVAGGTPRGQGGGAGPAVPSVVSVTIRSECAQTVKVFYGDKPKFGSGTYSTIDGHSSQNRTFRPGETMWIVDDSQNGAASTMVAVSTTEIAIPPSCASLDQR